MSNVAPAPAPAGVEVSQVANVLNLTPRRIQQLAKEGIIPRATRGRYNLVGCVRAYVAYLQAIVEKHNAQSAKLASDRLQEQRALKTAVEHELLQLQLKEKLGELVPAVDVEQRQERLCAYVRARVLSVRGKWAPKVLGLGTMAEATAVLDALAGDVLAALREQADELDDPGTEEEAA